MRVPAALPATDRRVTASATPTEAPHCDRCDAVCCRLTVIVFPEDQVPRWMVETDNHGIEVMARGEDGWCIALDHQRMCCSIYESRPESCRRFVMGAGYCRLEREEYRNQCPPIPSVLVTR